MTLVDFLRNQTNVMELCVIRDSGWIVATCWIDHEDLFCIPSHLKDKRVKRDVWDYLLIVNKNNAEMKIPCHYIDV